MLLSAGLAASDDLSYPFTTVTTDNVNMRRSASSSSVVLERIDKGDSITVLGTSGNYYKVSYNAVSYTHLDVYKRQAQGLWQAGVLL